VKFRDTFIDLAGIHNSSELAELASHIDADFVKKAKELTLKDEHRLIIAAAATLRPKAP
jgi:hypothetical protein